MILLSSCGGGKNRASWRDSLETPKQERNEENTQEKLRYGLDFSINHPNNFKFLHLQDQLTENVFAKFNLEIKKLESRKTKSFKVSLLNKPEQKSIFSFDNRFFKVLSEINCISWDNLKECSFYQVDSTIISSLDKFSDGEGSDLIIHVSKSFQIYRYIKNQYFYELQSGITSKLFDAETWIVYNAENLCPIQLIYTSRKSSKALPLPLYESEEKPLFPISNCMYIDYKYSIYFNLDHPQKIGKFVLSKPHRGFYLTYMGFKPSQDKFLDVQIRSQETDEVLDILTVKKVIEE